MAAPRHFLLNDANTDDVQASSHMEGTLSTWIVQVTAVAGAGTLEFRGRLSGSGVAVADAPALAYEDMSDGTTKTAAISAPGLFRVPCDNCDLFLVRTSGAGTSVEGYLKVLQEGR
jgi:hypothetical protein